MDERDTRSDSDRPTLEMSQAEIDAIVAEQHPCYRDAWPQYLAPLRAEEDK